LIVDKRFLAFVGFTIAALAMVFEPLRDLMVSASRSEFYSHIVLIPLVTGYLIYSRRKELLGNPFPAYGMGLVGVFGGIALYLFGVSEGVHLNENDLVSLWVLSAVVFWTGAFLLLYGWEAFRKNSFPFLFLVFMIPVPFAILHKIIYALQVASTEVADVLFSLSRVPYAREGFVFHLPGVSVEVADVCSGIRSSLALFITSILAGHMFLDKFCPGGLRLSRHCVQERHPHNYYFPPGSLCGPQVSDRELPSPIRRVHFLHSRAGAAGGGAFLAPQEERHAEA
jgi:exosortase